MEPLHPDDPEQVGGYRLEGRLGQGGMGQVFLGRSPGGRPVAVKLVRSEYAGDRQFRDRFAREVEAARRVGGFHTAPVVDADAKADPPWMVTAYIQGPSLNEAVARHGPMPAEEVRALGSALAEGLAAIHASGLVHRDLKPANVILAADGPRIIDFGIVRDLAASALTASGSVVGTVAYMSPEQIRGLPADPAGDVFSLGSVLAFAATGQSPFGTGPAATVLYRITTGEADLDGVPGTHGLRAAIAACLSVDPSDRPTVATVLKWLSTTGKPPPTPPAQESRPAETVPEPRRTTVPPPARNVPAPPPQRRSFSRPAKVTAVVVALLGAWGLLEKISVPPPRQPSSMAAFDGTITSLAFSSDGSNLASGEGRLNKGVARLWDAKLRISLPFYGFHTDQVRSVAFSADGRTLASGGDDGFVRLFDMASRKEFATLQGNGDDWYSVALSPDGKTVAAGSLNEHIQLWDVTSKRATADATARSDDGAEPGSALPRVLGVRSLAFSPDGKTLASSGYDTTISLWDVSAKGRLHLARRIRGSHPYQAYSLAFSPDGKRLASCARQKEVRLWNVQSKTPRRVATLTAELPIFQVAFTPDGKLLAGSSENGKKIQFWNASTGASKGSVSARGPVKAIALAPDGKTVAVGVGREIQFLKIPGS
ncbi:WD40 repeat domain-containing serine/threonine protein kinase [Spirillospora sp. CA-253888]